MSTLGKILTVLLVLVAIAVGGAATTEIVLREKWMALYEDQAKLFDKALEQRDIAIGQRDKTKNDWAAYAAEKEQTINTLTNQLNDANNQIVQLRKDKENQEARLQELTEKYKGLERDLTILLAERDQWRKERDDARKQFDDLTVMYTELQNQYRTKEADLASLKELNRQTAEEKKTIESKLAWIQQNHPEVKIPEPVPPIPVQKIQGLVTRVDNVEKVAEINLGTDDGVVKGMKFFVYNGQEMKYLATLVVTMVSKNSAAGELTTIRGRVKVDDHVTNKFDE